MSESLTDRQHWNRIANTYTQMTGTPFDRIYQQLKDVFWDSLGDIDGLEILDLGCGHGWLSKLMVDAGAAVWGVDGSVELLNRARQLCPQGEFTSANLAQGIPDMGKQFDRIVSYMVLMDIPAIDQLMNSVSHVLRPDGKFIFTITHPCFFNHKSRRDETTGKMYCGVTKYLQPERWWIETYGGHWHYHRSLTYYFQHLQANRLGVTRLYEPPQRPRTTENADFHKSIPKFMLLEAVPL